MAVKKMEHIYSLIGSCFGHSQSSSELWDSPEYVDYCIYDVVGFGYLALRGA